MSIVWEHVRPVSIDHDGPVDWPFEPIGREWADRPVLDRFEHIVERFGDKVAIDDGTDTLTFAQLRARGYALASLLRDAPKDRPIAVLIPAGVLSAAVAVAGLSLGIPFVPLDVTHPVSRKASILEEALPSMILVTEDTVIEPGLLPEGLPVRVVTMAELEAIDAPRPPPPPLKSLCGLMFTSGSTGRAKGIAFTQEGIIAGMADTVDALHTGPNDVILSMASITAGGSGDIITGMFTGAKVRMVDVRALGLHGVLDVIERDGVTMINMIPLVFRTLFADPSSKEKCRTVRGISTIGDRLLGSDIKLFRSRLSDTAYIRNSQGSTESGAVFSWFVPRDAVFDDQETVPSGYIARHKIVGMEAGASQGELLVKSSRMAAGAWQSGRLTPGPFVPDPVDESLRIFDTGDVVERLEGGLYRFIGRRDRQIKILGLRADPSDVEAILRKQPLVADAVVLPRRNGDEAVFAAFVTALDPLNPPAAETLQAAVAAEAQPHMVPADVHLIDEIPRLPNFKADFVTLTKWDRERMSSAPAPIAPVAAEPGLVAAVRKVWIATLGEASYTDGRAWNRSGGDSLKALQFILRLEEEVGRKVPLDLFDPGLTADGFTAVLARAFGEAPGADAGPVVFLFPGIGGDEPRLAALRKGLARRVSFETIEYPDLPESVAELSDRERLISRAIAQVEARAPKGPVRLAGYSLGGIVAFEVACRLAAQGRAVERLILIDSQLLPRLQSVTPAQIKALQAALPPTAPAQHAGLGAALQDKLVNFLIANRAFATLRGLILIRRKAGHRSVYAQKVLMERLRMKAFLGWKPSRFDGKALLIRSATQARGDVPEDLGWSEYLGSLEVATVPGNHWTMLDEPNIGQVWAAMARTLDDAPPPSAPAAQQAVPA